MDGPVRRRHGSRRDPAIDADVLRAARTLLVERGYAGTSIGLIAEAAQVSRPAIYRRWRSKAELIHEAAFPSLGEESVGEDISGEITRLCRGAVAMYRDPVVREAVPGLLADLRDQPAMRRLINDRLEAAARRQLATQLAQAAEDGTARIVNAHSVMDVIAGGAWYAVCVRKVSDTDAAGAALADVVLHGVLARS